MGSLAIRFRIAESRAGLRLAWLLFFFNQHSWFLLFFVAKQFRFLFGVHNMNTLRISVYMIAPEGVWYKHGIWLENFD